MASKEIASYNCTSWRSGLRFLQDARASVMVVMLQEHHLLAADAIVGAVAAAGRAGWHLLIELAVPSQGTATSTRYNTGGVAVAVRQRITARRLKAAGVVKGRAIVIEAIGAGLPSARITMASVYLEVGLADHEVNRNILAAVAEAVAPMVGPFIIGATTKCHRSSSRTPALRSCSTARSSPRHAVMRRFVGPMARRRSLTCSSFPEASPRLPAMCR